MLLDFKYCRQSDLKCYVQLHISRVKIVFALIAGGGVVKPGDSIPVVLKNLKFLFKGTVDLWSYINA